MELRRTDYVLFGLSLEYRTAGWTHNVFHHFFLLSRSSRNPRTIARAAERMACVVAWSSRSQASLRTLSVSTLSSVPSARTIKAYVLGGTSPRNGSRMPSHARTQ